MLAPLLTYLATTGYTNSYKGGDVATTIPKSFPRSAFLVDNKEACVVWPKP